MFYQEKYRILPELKCGCRISHEESDSPVGVCWVRLKMLWSVWTVKIKQFKKHTHLQTIKPSIVTISKVIAQ